MAGSRKHTGSNGGSAQDTEEEEGSELENFDLRKRWWAELFGGPDDDVCGVARKDAHDEVINRKRPPLAADDPGDEELDGDLELTTTRGKGGRITRTKNPRPKSSFGFIGKTIKVTGKDFQQGLLRARLPKKSTVDVSTVRLFRYDETSGNWSRVDRSGVDRTGTVGWATIRSQGTYTFIGSPDDEWLKATISAIDVYQPWLNASRDVGNYDQVLDRLCHFILCAGPFDDLRNDPSLGGEFGLPPFGGVDNICEFCTGLDIPGGGLPELDVFDEPPTSRGGSCNAWESVGPDNINGRIKSLAIDPTNGDQLYAGAADGGVWKSTNGGAVWFPTMDLELSMAIGSIAVAPSAPSIVYAATGEHTPGWGPSYPGVGIYRTTDGGRDWDLVSTPADVSSRCSRILVHPTDPNTVYVGGNRGVHASTDGGVTWTLLRGGATSDLLLDPTSPNVLYCGTRNSGIFRSDDAGVTWLRLDDGVIPVGTAADWIKLAMGRNGAGGTNFLVAKMGTDSGAIFTSADGGQNWVQLPGTHHPVSFNEWTNMIAVDPNNHDVLHAGGVGYSRSTDGGATFAAVGGTHSDHHEIVFDPRDSDTIFMATDGGVYRSTDAGASWELRSNKLTATQLYSIGVSQTSPIILGAATQDQGIIRRVGLSDDWVNTRAGNEGGRFVVDPNNSDNVYTTPWSSKFRRSTDGAVTWTTIVDNVGDPAVDSIRNVVVKPGDSNVLLVSAETKLFSSDDQGDSFVEEIDLGDNCSAIAYAPSDGSIAYAVTHQGRVFTSTSGGIGGWTELVSPGLPTSMYVSSLSVGWDDPNYLVVGYGRSGAPTVWVSEDGGATWADAGGVLETDALPAVSITSVALHPFERETMWASTEIGVFRSRDGGDSWESFDKGMPRIVTTQLAIRKSTRRMYVSTMGRGAFSRRI